jgi:hypothetical protein
MHHKQGGNMINEFRQKLEHDDKTVKEFLAEYLPSYKYSRFSSQINGFNDIQPKAIEAIKKYLSE